MADLKINIPSITPDKDGSKVLESVNPESTHFLADLKINSSELSPESVNPEKNILYSEATNRIHFSGATNWKDLHINSISPNININGFKLVAESVPVQVKSVPIQKWTKEMEKGVSANERETSNQETPLLRNTRVRQPG